MSTVNPQTWGSIFGVSNNQIDIEFCNIGIMPVIFFFITTFWIYLKELNLFVTSESETVKE